MKKILGILLFLAILLVPTVASAKTYNFKGYYCDQKQPLNDGTFYMTCHIVAKTDFNVNHIEGTLILKNVKLESIKTNNDWANNNGTSSNVSFTSSSNHFGSLSVADLVFTGNLSDTECEASFMPKLVEETTQVCKIVDDTYYGKDGKIVDAKTYYEDCCNYVCTVVDNTYYFNSKGKSVTYDEMLEDCKTTEIIENPKTGIDFGYIILPLGILSLIGIVKFSKKNTKIYKI